MFAVSAEYSWGCGALWWRHACFLGGYFGVEKWKRARGDAQPNNNSLTCKKSLLCRELEKEKSAFWLSLTLLYCETQRQGTKRTSGGQEAVGMCPDLGLSQGAESLATLHTGHIL